MRIEVIEHDDGVKKKKTKKKKKKTEGEI